MLCSRVRQKSDDEDMKRCLDDEKPALTETPSFVPSPARCLVVEQTCAWRLAAGKQPLQCTAYKHRGQLQCSTTVPMFLHAWFSEYLAKRCSHWRKGPWVSAFSFFWHGISDQWWQQRLHLRIAVVSCAEMAAHLSPGQRFNGELPSFEYKIPVTVLGRQMGWEPWWY